LSTVDLNLPILLLILGMTLVTAWTRSFFLILGERVKVPAWVLESIRFAPLAAMVAILAPEMFLPASASSISEFNLRLPNVWGGIAAVIAFYYTKKMLSTLIIGMAVYTAARFLL
jgi:branched-subunit amino acid transport protein